MVALQIISKILETKDFSLVTRNQLDENYFPEYLDEFKFISEHYQKYGNVPDKATFLSQFPDIDLVEVTESDRYLIDTIREENLYHRSTPVLQKVAELLKVDANAATAYMVKSLPDLQPNYGIGGVDIVANAKQRFEQFKEHKENPDKFMYTSGFPELDDVIHGIKRKEELLVIVARTNEGKSWVLEKMCNHIWKLGANVGYISIEMGEESIGYRFDTLDNNFSNSGLMWGNNDVDEDAYKKYIDELSTKKNRFVVSDAKDFGREITVTKLREWVKQFELNVVAIDGITYLTDERFHKGDTKASMLTSISEDLMSMSKELEVPVLVVAQANRGAVNHDDENAVPELETIKDSDGISHNASKVIAIRQTKEGVLKMQVKKQRFGRVGDKLSYRWNINKGEFEYMPTFDDAQPKENTAKRTRKQQESVEDVF